MCAQVEAELAKVRRIATEASEEGARLADLAARGSKNQAIANAHTREVGPVAYLSSFGISAVS